MSTETIDLSGTRLSLLARLRDHADGANWREFHPIYQVARTRRPADDPDP